MTKPEPKKRLDFKLPTGILGASLAPDGKSLFAACFDGVYRADLETKNDDKLYQHDSYVSSVAMISDSALVSAGYDGAVRWYETASGAITRTEQLHEFWSWDMTVSPDKKLIASVTGQYLAGGYKYEPQAEREPSIKVVSVESGETLHSFPHVPSVQSVAFSPDGRFVAAGNLMGEVRVFSLDEDRMVANFTTPDFTSWGIIKSHCYLGGIFALKFTPQGDALLLTGMGPMHDPMAGNGRQLWQKWSWREEEPQKLDETHQGESGKGLMETLAIHPTDDQFAMAGRLREGDTNVSFFQLSSGNRLTGLKTGFRVTEALYTPGGHQLILVGAQGQPSQKKDGKFPRFGRVEVYDLHS